MAQSKILNFELPVVAISLAVWIKSCRDESQLKVARAYSENILDMHFGSSAATTLVKLMELCDKQADYLKFKEPDYANRPIDL
jgi:hypothetical protein